MVRLAEAVTVRAPVMAPARLTLLLRAGDTVAVAVTDVAMDNSCPDSPFRVARLSTAPLNSTRCPDHANVIDSDAAGKVTVSDWLSVLEMVRAPQNNRLPPVLAS